MLQCCSAASGRVRRDSKGKQTSLPPGGGWQSGSPSVGPSGVTLNDVSRDKHVTSLLDVFAIQTI